MVRLVHAVVRSSLVAFHVSSSNNHLPQIACNFIRVQGQDAANMQPLQEKFEMWYQNMTRDGLEVPCHCNKQLVSQGGLTIFII